MMTILLYGFLGRQFGRIHKRDVKTVAEAVRALRVTLPGFEKALIDGGAYRVLVGGKEALEKEQLCDPISRRNTLRIVPTIMGSGGLAKAILGAVLVVVGYYFGQGWLVNIGASMILGGVAEMLFSAKPAGPAGAAERPENKPSYSFDGAINTAAQGNPVSILYGKLTIGSQVISAGLFTEEI